MARNGRKSTRADLSSVNPNPATGAREGPSPERRELARDLALLIHRALRRQKMQPEPPAKEKTRVG
jgi:hypothetical protein